MDNQQDLVVPKLSLNEIGNILIIILFCPALRNAWHTTGRALHRQTVSRAELRIHSSAWNAVSGRHKQNRPA